MAPEVVVLTVLSGLLGTRRNIQYVHSVWRNSKSLRFPYTGFEVAFEDRNFP
jgi:hypothetical protein